MHNTRRRSELLDSLDYLIPPVKKLSRAVYKDFLYNDIKLTDQKRLLRDCHRTVFGNPSWSKTSESEVQTCSSLILHKTTKQLIQEQYSILNLSTCNNGPDLYIENKTKERKEDKPIIKVTVIPKTKEIQRSTIFNKRCRYSKSIQNTVSNQENSIKNQNIYLLNKGRKREKFHELKTSESAKLSNRNINHKYGDISIDQITESKHIINSLNMDKRKHKGNKNKMAIRTHTSDDHDASKDRCGDQFLNPKDRNSRVTVVGQIGVTANDRYVMKCSAAVNNKPIHSKIFKEDGANEIPLVKNYNFHHSSIPCKPTGCNINNCETFREFRQQDSNVQTDIGNTHYLLETMLNNRGASQSTQVNFNFPNPQSIKKFRNQTAQCNCNSEITTNSLDTEKDNVIKEFKSPLVIISVYPRQEKRKDDNDTVKIIQRHTSPERKEITNILRTNMRQENFKQLRPGKLYTTNKVEAKLPKSRSPSPKTKNGSQKYIENKTHTRGKNDSVKKCGLSQTRSHKSYVINSLEDHTSCHCGESNFFQTEDFNRQQIKTSKSKETEEVKKALVNSFLRNVNVMDKDNRKSKLFQSKDDASKITINIDDENECCDILLERSKYDTGVSIKKTTKVQPSQTVSSEEEVNTKSLENFLLAPRDRRKKNEYKQETESTQPEPGVLKINATASRLNVKDSIEIFRRQGDHSSYHLKPQLKNYKKNFADTVFKSNSYAPVKHYQGDDCSLSDPNERDREIRQLLGIMRCHRLQNTDAMSTRQSSLSSETLPSLKRKNKSSESGHVATQINPNKATPEPLEQLSEDSKEPPIQRTTGNATLVKRTSKTETSVKDTHLPVHTVHMNDSIMPQNLILNRNIQIFLQVEQFSKERPVLLTRKQYNKVKRIIECKISKKLSINKHKRWSLNNCNVTSIGEIKVKPKLQLRINREIQTDRAKMAAGITDKYKRKCTRAHGTKHVINNKIEKSIATDVLVPEAHNIEPTNPRQTVSSMEIRYSSVEYKKRDIISSSSTRFKNDIIHSLQTNNAERNSNSIHTIFKGYKRSATPNFGTSAFSLYSNLTDFSKKSYKQPQCAGDFKPKKPFLQRLISCLIMRSTLTSNIKDHLTAPQRKLPSVNNSLDSYHISTSLGALEMSSSLYDTSASFYSNHTTVPVNKMKRGFFSSVRGFLTSRRT